MSETVGAAEARDLAAVRLAQAGAPQAHALAAPSSPAVQEISS